MDGRVVHLTSKNVRNNPDRLELKKYSPKLRRHAIFRETK
nr:50S ribosomal protein L33 [Lentilactobacillus hilgardii]